MGKNEWEWGYDGVILVKGKEGRIRKIKSKRNIRKKFCSERIRGGFVRGEVFYKKEKRRRWLEEKWMKSSNFMEGEMVEEDIGIGEMGEKKEFE